jgi:hypothetical protein
MYPVLYSVLCTFTFLATWLEAGGPTDRWLADRCKSSIVNLLCTFAKNVNVLSECAEQVYNTGFTPISQPPISGSPGLQPRTLPGLPREGCENRIPPLETFETLELLGTGRSLPRKTRESPWLEAGPYSVHLHF